MTKKKILIVEDDEALRMALAQYLRKEATISEAEDGEKAIEYLKKEQPELILLDIKLPKINGMEVLKFVRKNKKTTHIPVIIISNLDNQTLVAQGLMLGAKDYLAKAHYSLDEMLEMVRMRLK